MTDIRGIVQTVLDNALSEEGVRVFWHKKTETRGDDPDDYIVYTLDGDSSEFYADDDPIVKAANVAVRYYYRNIMLDTHTGRNTVKNREETIATALIENGFSLPYGYMDAGDIDDIGYGVTLFECEYWRAE
jgi:hypothetical protein